MKRYLCCVALALCVSGSAYANKGGNLGKSGIDKLGHWLINNKAGQAGIALLLLGQVCFSGCGKGENPVASTETNTEVMAETQVVETTVQVISDYDGDNIYFKQGGAIFEGHVIEGISIDEVLVRLADGSEMVVDVNEIGGTLILDHPDVGTEVVMLGDRDKGEKLLQGEVAKVFTDGNHKIEIFSIGFIGGGGERLDVPRIRYENKDTDFKKGGFLTLDEFAEWLDN